MPLPGSATLRHTCASQRSELPRRVMLKILAESTAMTHNDHFHTIERRHDGPVEVVDTGLDVASREGVGPALEFMLTHGVDRFTALRVLAGPEFHRPSPSSPDEGQVVPGF